ncbi:hypothetical protein [Agreia bicolorata]|uniref:hypothetical protein n=1 Tax=Agreia bicolorata TaxID=110935 RepID=UPI001C6FC742|nr:hypothetical protein [Agreia bicolorata]
MSQPEPPLVVIGEIAVTSSWLVTPAGTVPLAGTEFFVTDFTRVEQKTPTWAIVLAIVGFFFVFVLSLLFLLARESRLTGFVQVTARNGHLQYQSNVPVTSAATAPDVFGRVQYARHVVSLAG